MKSAQAESSSAGRRSSQPFSFFWPPYNLHTRILALTIRRQIKPKGSYCSMTIDKTIRLVRFLFFFISCCMSCLVKVTVLFFLLFP